MTDEPIRPLGNMIRIRVLEERCAELYGRMKIRGFLHLAIGEEAIAAGIIPQLGADDALLATYREHGHALLRGVGADRIMAEMFGKATGCSGGRGGSMHLFDASTRFYGGNAIVGGHLPLAVGLALADKMQGREGRVTVCFFGEGAVAEGEFHESMNLAALWRLPVLFCCENNLYAMGTSLATSESQTQLALKASSYQVTAWTVDGMDVGAVAKAASDALDSIRGGGGPVFLECRTYRFRPHSMFDPDLYRTDEEIAAWKKRDPITLEIDRLKRLGAISDDGLEALWEGARVEIEAAIEYAEAAPWEEAADLLKHVYAEVEGGSSNGGLGR